MKKYILIFIFFPLLNLYGQKEFNNWIFHNNVGFTFNDYDGLPRALGKDEINPDFSRSMQLPRKISHPISISDSSGNLLFYSNGREVYNRKHEIMPNGILSDLYELWNERYADQLTVVQSHQNPNQYLFFYAKKLTIEGEDPNSNYLCKAILDMTHDNGYGDMILKDSVIASNPSLSLPRTILIIRLQDNSYMLYYMDDNKIKGYSINKEEFIEINNFNLETYGFLAVSPDFTKILTAGLCVNYLVDIDTRTGAFINYTEINSYYYPNLPREYSFSADGTKLYIYGEAEYLGVGLCRIHNWHLYQYDIPTGTRHIVANQNLNFGLRTMRLGPDGKIYLGRPWNNKISVIHNPNALGDDCNLEVDAFALSGDLEAREMVSFFPYYIGSKMFFNATTNSPLCEGGSLHLSAIVPHYCTDAVFEWRGPLGFTSSEQHPVLENISTKHSGDYHLKVRSSAGNYDRVINVVVHTMPKAKLHPLTKDTILCYGQSLRLRAFPRELNEKYYWSTGESSPEISVTESGEYVLTTVAEGGCFVSDTIRVFFEVAEAAIIGDSLICGGQFSELIAIPESENYEYLWSTGERTSRIKASETGKYSVSISKTLNCSAEASFDLLVIDKPLAEIATDASPCDGPPISLYSKHHKYNYDYIWSSGETSRTITADTAGTYRLIVRDIHYGCSDTAYFTLGERLSAAIEADEHCLISGGSTTLRAKYARAGLTYIWSTGETSEEITINEPGRYGLYVEDMHGCSDSSDIEIYLAPEVEIIGETKICAGESVVLSSQSDYSSYKWSNGSSEKSITITAAGIYTLQITDENGCVAQSSVEVEQYEMNLQFTDNFYLESLLNREYEISIKFENNGNEDIIIESIELTNDNFRKRNEIEKINSHGEATLQIIFTPQSIGNLQCEILIMTASPCREQHKVTIISDVEIGLTSKVWLPEMEVLPGEMATIPLYATFNEDMDMELDYVAELLIKRDILSLDSEPQGIWQQISLSGSATVSRSEQEIGAIEGLVLFGESPSEMRIKTIKWSEEVPTVAENGQLTIAGVCSPDIRYIIMRPDAIFWTESQVYANEIEISYTNIEEDEYYIKMYNYLGDKVGEENARISGHGKRKMNVEYLSNGTYYIIISNSSSTMNLGKIMIVK